MKTLQKKIKQLSAKGMRKVNSAKTLLKFSEKPTVASSDRLEAHDLFSYFTANIIEEKITFTR